MRDDGGKSPARRVMLDRSEEAAAAPRNRAGGPGRTPMLDLARLGAMVCDADSPDVLRAYVLDQRRVARQALDAELGQMLAGTGFDARDLCARELTARIADLSVFELLQTIANGRKDATIDVFQGSLVGRIWCMGGQVVDAVSGLLAGESAVYRILALDQGELVVDFRTVRRRQIVTSSTLTLMLEGSRRKDECAVIEKRLGGIQRAYRCVEEARGAVEAASQEATLLAAFEGGARIETVLANGELDDLCALQAIARLVEHGALVATDPPQALVLLKTASATQHVVQANQQAALPSPAPRRRSAWCSVGAIVAASSALVVSGLLIRADGVDGPSAVHQTARALTPEPAAPAAPPSPSQASPDAYPVQVIVEPAGAELWLDGAWMATGQLSIVLERTGQTHELRIAAPDHQPRTLLFRDAPPPLNVRLLAAPTPATTPSDAPSR
jgi:hypothetical protein